MTGVLHHTGGPIPIKPLPELSAVAQLGRRLLCAFQTGHCWHADEPAGSFCCGCGRDTPRTITMSRCLLCRQITKAQDHG